METNYLLPIASIINYEQWASAIIILFTAVISVKVVPRELTLYVNVVCLIKLHFICLHCQNFITSVTRFV